MSFLEWWGESVDPGKVGSIELSGEHEACQCRPLVAARLVAVSIGMPIIWYQIVPHVPLPTWQAVVVVVGGSLIYIALSYLIDPQPDLENIGPCAGLIDHPWRYSDDINRGMLLAKCLLGPGRFLAESVLDARLLLRNDADAADP